VSGDVGKKPDSVVLDVMVSAEIAGGGIIVRVKKNLHSQVESNKHNLIYKN